MMRTLASLVVVDVPDGDEAAFATGTAFEPLIALFAPELRADPYPYFEQLLADRPVIDGAFGSKVLSRHAHCMALLRHRGASVDATRSERFGALAQARRRELQDHLGLEIEGEMRPFLFMDPPDHTRLRGLVGKAFTPKRVQLLEPSVRTIANRLLDAALEQGTVDVVSSLAYPLPLSVICELLGVPDDARPQFKRWSDALARGLDPEFLLPPDQAAERAEAMRGFVEFFRELIAARRRQPRDDLLSDLVTVEEHGERLSEGELLSTLILLLVAGHETTVNLIGNAVLLLTRRPEVQAALRAEPGLVRGVVEEVLRLDPPVQLTARFAAEDLNLGDGVVVPKGAIAIALLPAANRDPEVFEHPRQFDPCREPNPHLSFGFGIHHCLGAPLARLEARIALGTLIERTTSVERNADDALRYKENIVLRGLERLDVALRAA
jgi:cytochrome P450